MKQTRTTTEPASPAARGDESAAQRCLIVPSSRVAGASGSAQRAKTKFACDGTGRIPRSRSTSKSAARSPRTRAKKSVTSPSGNASRASAIRITCPGDDKDFQRLCAALREAAEEMAR